jgi:hypothetical protein
MADDTPQYVKCNVKLESFRGATLRSDHLVLYKDGSVVCPAEFGGWTGHLVFSDEEKCYFMHYHGNGANIAPKKQDVWLDRKLIEERFAVASHIMRGWVEQQRIFRFLLEGDQTTTTMAVDVPNGDVEAFRALCRGRGWKVS